jgi:hypothetical protein
MIVLNGPNDERVAQTLKRIQSAREKGRAAAKAKAKAESTPSGAAAPAPAAAKSDGSKHNN